MTEYVDKSAREKTIEAMGYHEANTPDGFRYERDW